MRVAHIEIRNLRVLNEVVLAPGPGINVFSGPNGSGKSSFVEALGIGLSGRSFRAGKLGSAMAWGEQAFYVGFRSEDGVGRHLKQRLIRNLGKTTLEVNGQLVKSLSEYARRNPIWFLTVDSHDVWEGSPRERRRFLDKVGFHVKPNYLAAWSDYYRVLKQRNILLKSGAIGRDLDGWDRLLVESGRRLQALRLEIAGDLDVRFQENLSVVLEMQGSLEYHDSWIGRDALERVTQTRESDVKSGTTQTGPHRGDIRFSIRDAATSELSRGQTKLAMASLLFSASDAVAACTAIRSLVAIDDFTAELDPAGRAKLGGLIAGSDYQCFVTSVEPETALQSAFPGSYAAFHVKQGQVEPA